MNQLKNFVKLEFLSAKAEPSAKTTLILYAVLFLVILVVTPRHPASGAMLVMIFTHFCIAAPFGVSEQYNMDALYVSLSISRKTIVLGRYIYAFTMLFGIILLYFAFLSVFRFIAGRFIYVHSCANCTLWTPIFLSVLLIIIQTIQLPLAFKLKISRIHTYILALLVILLMLGSALIPFLKREGILDNFAAFIARMGWLVIPGAVLVLAAAVFVSFRFALAFYQSREF